jgi:hypothetical protein
MQCGKIRRSVAVLRQQTEAIGGIGQVDCAQQVIILVEDSGAKQALEETDKSCHDILIICLRCIDDGTTRLSHQALIRTVTNSALLTTRFANSATHLLDELIIGVASQNNFIESATPSFFLAV